MKKSVFLVTLIFVLSTFAFAGDGDGNMPHGKTCPNGQTTCLVDRETTESTKTDATFKTILEYLKNLFG